MAFTGVYFADLLWFVVERTFVMNLRKTGT